MFSTECQYALRAIGSLAHSGQRVPTRALAARIMAPAPMLAKVLARLAHAGFVSGSTGPNGGYLLTGAPQQIGLLPIVEAIDGPRFAGGCLLGRARCDGARPCALHDTWIETGRRLRAWLADSTAADLIDAEVPTRVGPQRGRTGRRAGLGQPRGRSPR